MPPRKNKKQAALKAEAEQAYQSRLQQDINRAEQEIEERYKQEIQQLQSLVIQRDKTICALEQQIELLKLQNILQQQTTNLNQYQSQFRPNT
jgi:hypothetical protein